MADFIFIDNGRIRPASGIRVIKASAYAALREPRQVLEDARNHAAGIIKDSEAVFLSEKTRGYQEGLREGGQQMAEQVAATALRCELHYRELQKETVGLVMEIFKKVLQDLDPGQLIEAQVKKALDIFKGDKRVVIKVHPDQAGLLHDRLSEIMAAYPGIDIIDIKAVPNLSADQVILEGETGIVEASMAVQLAAVEHAFKKELRILD